MRVSRLVARIHDYANFKPHEELLHNADISRRSLQRLGKDRWMRQNVYDAMPTFPKICSFTPSHGMAICLAFSAHEIALKKATTTST